MSRVMKDLAVDRERNPAAAAADRWDPEEEEEEDEGDDIDIIDRSTFRPSSLFLPRVIHAFALALFVHERITFVVTLIHTTFHPRYDADDHYLHALSAQVKSRGLAST